MSKQRITPFLWFDGQAKEAMKFYVSVFNKSKVVSVTCYGEAGPGPKGTVMSAIFQLEGLMQMDKIDIKRLKQAYAQG